MENDAWLQEIPSPTITVRVQTWEHPDSPPFYGSYVFVKGGMESGKSTKLQHRHIRIISMS